VRQKQRKGNRQAHPRGTDPRVNSITKKSAPGGWDQEHAVTSQRSAKRRMKADADYWEKLKSSPGPAPGSTGRSKWLSAYEVGYVVECPGPGGGFICDYWKAPAGFARAVGLGELKHAQWFSEQREAEAMAYWNMGRKAVVRIVRRRLKDGKIVGL
jgi:hypothetical protein